MTDNIFDKKVTEAEAEACDYNVGVSTFVETSFDKLKNNQDNPFVVTYLRALTSLPPIADIDDIAEITSEVIKSFAELIVEYDKILNE